MKLKKCIKDAFVVIGKEGSTLEGQGFIQSLWADANAHFAQVQPLAKKDKDGNLVGIWGAMSDFSRSYQPWEENFSKGLYLAGVECLDEAQAPEGWTNGRFRAMSIFVPRWKMKIHFQRCWTICGTIKSRWWEQFRIFPVR